MTYANLIQSSSNICLPRSDHMINIKKNNKNKPKRMPAPQSSTTIRVAWPSSSSSSSIVM